MKKVRNSILLVFIASTNMSHIAYTNEHAIGLSTHEGQYINEEIIELSFIFNRFLKKWTQGTHKMPFTLHGKPHSLQTLAALEQESARESKSLSAEYADLLMYAKQKFIRKTKRFIDCSRSFSKVLFPLIEEDCVQRNRSHSFLRTWIQTDKQESIELFMNHITSFTDLYDLCTDLMHLIKDIVYSSPKALHAFELKMKKIKKFKELLPHMLKELHIKESDINTKELIAEFKFHEVSSLSLDEITPKQVHVIIQTFLQRTNESPKT